MSSSNDPKVIVALDYPDMEPALDLARRLDPSACRLKIGKEMFTRCGPAVVAGVQQLGFEVFLDLKFHDIPNTVAGACRSAAALGVWMINVHCLGGRRMMNAAVEAVAGVASRPKLIGVTVLTSMGEDDIAEIGLSGPVPERVLALAALARDSGLDGVVCSPLEIAPIRADQDADFLLVTPGIRPANSSVDDQKRIMTPSEALTAGASYLVIGRPITRAEDPLAALEAINRSLT